MYWLCRPYCPPYAKLIQFAQFDPLTLLKPISYDSRRQQHHDPLLRLDYEAKVLPGTLIRVTATDRPRKQTMLEQQIKEVPAYANITPRAVKLLHNFFVNIATDEEKNELDGWMHESNANDCLFDLLLEFDFKPTKIETIPMLRKLLSRADTGIFPV
ncbi:hypothetical protein [Flavihumibacter fluvii]|uniref:hypothetical protein n=1 Tax=Flavihumibacter fluvii TaxID=2838157 RepID=UPI001BDF11FB|nr:hypothetical protein [Flavihumibacter fluvii]ULQ51743.1 hypothetical protein KJS93_16775 [Flavihumibacter fluvii]